MIVDIHFVNT